MNSLPTWLQGLIAAAVGGAANAGGNWVGLAAAKGFGLEVPVLNWKALGLMCLLGSLISVFAYLKQSPIPTSSTTTTLSVTKEVTKTDDK